MLYTKKDLVKLLEDKNITTTAKSIAQLLLIALDFGAVTREELLAETDAEREPPKPRGRPRKYPVQESDEPKVKRSRGRPRKYPPKEVDPNKVIDPKYERLLTIRNNPRTISMTNVETGETIKYGSSYKATIATGHTLKYFDHHNGKVVDGFKIEVN